MNTPAFVLARSIVPLVATLTFARLAAAQVVTGKVSSRGDGAPVPGAIVALLDSSGRAVETKLAEDGGGFRFTVPHEGHYTLRVERVGYRSATTNSFVVRLDSTLEMPIVIASDGVSLRAVKVSADRRCIVRPQEGLAAAQLWDEARKALNATQLTQLAQAATKARRDPHRFAVRWRKFKRDLEPRTLESRSVEQVELEGEAVTPFASADPEVLARNGYVAGNIETGSTFYAPDGSILLSDRFLDTHCFRVQAPDEGRRDDLIGLAFEPVRLTIAQQPSRVDVRGVLWLDRSTAELRYLEYGYVNLPFIADEKHVGGRLEFRPLPDGRWIVWRWYIRTPGLERRRQVINSQLTDWQTEIVRIREDGAELLEVMPAGSARKRHGIIRGAVVDSLRHTSVPGVQVFLSGTSLSTRTDTAGHFQIDSIPPGSYTLSIVYPRIDTLLIDPPARDVSVSAGDEQDIDLTLPSFQTVASRLCAGAVTDSTALLVGIVRDTGATKAAGAHVRAEWSEVARRGTESVGVRTVWVETAAGAAGRYALCPPGGVRLNVRAELHGRRVAVPQSAVRASDVRRLDITFKNP